jgi:hypothetical protein
MSKIQLDGGKYTVVSDKGGLRALRNGQEWRDLSGDNLVYYMLCRIEELTEAANRAAARLDEVSKLVDECNGDAVDWIIDNQYSNKELATELRDATEA